MTEFGVVTVRGAAKTNGPGVVVGRPGFDVVPGGLLEQFALAERCRWAPSSGYGQPQRLLPVLAVLECPGRTS